ncbi:MAG: hypothetical protein ABF461_07360 [Zymomonas mobilis subsp. pomaceae]|uniref:hypothetical protein n=1 Tax=Zymomonas mobilis TaxID=542 RepID=UPI00030E5528
MPLLSCPKEVLPLKGLLARLWPQKKPVIVLFFFQNVNKGFGIKNIAAVHENSGNKSCKNIDLKN